MKTKSTLSNVLHLLLPAALSLMVMLTAGCTGKTSTDEAFFFTPIDPAADSLMREFEIVSRGIDDREGGIDSIFIRLDSIAGAMSNRQLKARSLYVKAWLYSGEGKENEAVAMLDSALALTDSVAYPYDQACMYIDKAYGVDGPWSDTYRRLQNDLVVFKEANDSFRVSQVYNFIGTINYVFGDDDGAVKNYTLAVDWLPARYEYQKFIGYFNTTLTLYRQGKAEQWYPRVDSLKRSEFLDEGERIKTMTMVMSYKKSGEVADLLDAYRSACRPVDPEWCKPYVSSLLADYYRKTGDYDSMLYYANIMRNGITDEVKRFAYYCDILDVNKRVYEKEGKTDSARMAKEEYVHLKDKQAAMDDAAKVTNEQMKAELAEIDRTIAEERESSTIRKWIVIVVSVVIVGGLVCLVVIWLIRRHRREYSDLESVLQQKERRIAAAEMRASEMDQALADIARDVRGIRPEDAEIVTRIMSTINVSRTGDSEWEKFSLLFGEMHPDFTDSLRRDYPKLTPGDVELACMVFLGLETKHIARMLSINPDSVKKNRQRLRAKLGLTPDQPLDLFLRDYERARAKRSR